MTISNLTPHDLRVAIAPESLGFTDTSALLHHRLPWIGQARAETAARFGLGMAQPDYNLFVLGEVGSGRSSLLQQVMHEMAQEMTSQVLSELRLLASSRFDSQSLSCIVMAGDC